MSRANGRRRQNVVAVVGMCNDSNLVERYRDTVKRFTELCEADRRQSSDGTYTLRLMQAFEKRLGIA